MQNTKVFEQEYTCQIKYIIFRKIENSAEVDPAYATQSKEDKIEKVWKIGHTKRMQHKLH